MTDVTKPAHSPLGASGAERWMNCPGSVELLKELALPETDEPDYRREGTALHEAAAQAFLGGLDAWELVGQTFHDTEIDNDMGDAIQTYLDYVRPISDKAVRVWVETALSSPRRDDFYGTVDFGALLIDQPAIEVEANPNRIEVVDLKGGKGIMVDVEDNPQLKYYGFLLIDNLIRSGYFVPAGDMVVRLTIIQPRGFHYAGPVRSWDTTWAELREWVDDTLVPAMARTEMDGTLDAGEWCRFCPAKLVCPLLTGLFRAAASNDPREVVNASDAALGQNYAYTKAVKFYIKALEEEVFNRLSAGREVPGTVLTNKRANRVFKSEVRGQKLEDALREKFGEKAYTEPEPKSPPEIEKLGTDGKTFVKEWAYTPQTGYTVALASDKSVIPVRVQPIAETFKAALENLSTLTC